MFKSALVLLFILMCISGASVAQTFTSSQPGPWDLSSTWGGAGVPTAANSTAIIVNHAVTVPTGFTATIDQTTVTGSIVVNTGGILEIVNGTGNDLTLSGGGVLDVTGRLDKADLAVIIGTTGGNTNFRSGSIYRHLNTASEGAAPTATWDANSTVEIAAWTASKTLVSTSWSQTFGHFIYNCPSQVSTINFNGLLTNVQGDLTIQNTNSVPVQLVGNGQTRTLTIGGDFSVLGTSRLYLNLTGNATVNIGGDFIFNSTNSSESFICSFGNSTLNITRDFSMNAPGGLLYVGAGSPSTGIATLNVGDDFILIAGTLRENGDASQAEINFNNSSSHDFINTGTIFGTFDYSISATDELVVGATSALSGSNGVGVTSDFNLNGRFVLLSADALGALRLGTSLGNLRTPDATRSFNSGSTIVYQGTAAQAVGDGHPLASGVNVEINNSNGLSYASNINTVTVTGNLSLISGMLLVSSSSSVRTLTLSGGVSSTGGNLGFSGPLSDLVINGSGVATLVFNGSAQSVRNFTLNRSSGAALGSSVTVIGSLILTSGDLTFNNQALTISGTPSVTGGRLSSNAISTLAITGSGAFGTIPPFAPGGNTLGTLTLNRIPSGSATVNGTIIVSSALNLTNGSLTNTGGLTLDNSATIVRTPTSSLLANRVISDPGDSYNVTYSGSTITPGLELPASTNDEDLNHLTINGSVNLNQDIIINGDFSINSGTFTNGAFIITMDETGNWSDNLGFFTPGTGMVVFDGNTTVGGTSTPAFANILISGGATVNLPFGNVTVTGNITANPGATVNANNGTISLTGAALQTISANGATLHHLAVNKLSASDVMLASPLGITGHLSIQSSGIDVTSNGNLTLRSVSDGTVGTGSIGVLPGTANVIGDVTVQRFHSAEGPVNRYISSPITNARVIDLQDDFPITGNFTGTSYPCTGCLNNGSSLKYYNEPTLGPFNKGYLGYPASSSINTVPLVVGRGYLAYMWQGASQITWDVTGPINKGTIVLPITVTPSVPPDPNADGWNLVGNPYPSSIDWDNASGWTKTNIAPTVYVYDGPAGVFRTWNGTTGDLPNGVIASCQSFWVYASGSAALSINEQAKTNVTGAFFRRAETEYPTLVFSISEGNRKDNSFLVMVDGSSEGVELNARKLEGENLAVSIADQNNVKWVTYATPQNQNEVNYPLSVLSEMGKVYTLSFESKGGFELNDWKLYDSYEDTYINLSKTKRYTFTGHDTDPHRFRLIKGDVETGSDISSDVSVFPNPASEKVSITWNGKGRSRLNIVNSVGTQMSAEYILASDETIEVDVRSWQSGLYVAKIVAEGKYLVHKIIKK